MKFTNHFFFLTLFCVLIFTSCKKEEILKDSSAKLDFSTGTVVYDTVFSSIGSTTKVFKIYNNHNKKINISKLFLATGPASQFRINVDGVSSYSHTDVEILPKDSMFVFVQVTVNPSSANSPLLIRDSVIFETNGNVQDVKLTAIGQNVYLHKPNVFPINGLPPYSIISCSTPWTSDKPHLIFGYAVVDSDSILTINSGTRVYMNTGAILWVFKDGTLNIKGEKGKEVTFQGARLESDYKDIAGQWGKIWMMAGSKNNSINWAIIKNGSIGVQVDSLGTAGVPTLKLTNTVIKNMAAAAIYARNSHIRSNNCVFANCGQYLAAISTGGKYRFEHCTFANYWTQSQRTTPSIYLSNYNINGSVYTVSNLDSAYFGNCIVYGDKAEEVEIDASTYGGNFSYKFENSLLKTGKTITDDGIHFSSVYSNVDPEFANISGSDFQLKVSSPAIDKGYSNLLSKDLNDENRPNPSTSISDLGAFEYYQK
jgi:hypothetical protein